MNKLFKWKFLFVLSLVLTILSGEMFKGSKAMTSFHSLVMLIVILTSIVVFARNWDKI